MVEIKKTKPYRIEGTGKEREIKKFIDDFLYEFDPEYYTIVQYKVDETIDYIKGFKYNNEKTIKAYEWTLRIYGNNHTKKYGFEFSLNTKNIFPLLVYKYEKRINEAYNKIIEKNKGENDIDDEDNKKNIDDIILE